MWAAKAYGFRSLVPLALAFHAVRHYIRRTGLKMTLPDFRRGALKRGGRSLGLGRFFVITQGSACNEHIRFCQ
jgi:hypothetical protein